VLLLPNVKEIVWGCECGIDFISALFVAIAQSANNINHPVCRIFLFGEMEAQLGKIGVQVLGAATVHLLASSTQEQ
jgi:hypothetical protein